MSILKDDVKAVLNTKEGRSVMLQIMLIAGWEKVPYTPGDAQATAFHCGQKSVAQYIQDLVVSTDPALLTQMLQEREELRKQHEQLQNLQNGIKASMQKVKVVMDELGAKK